ncbi:MAG TPA: GYF domain-containing protein [Polyangiaceae bacterium]
MADDELWHVRISADEVKELTLEQIDDLYRLDVIDADTQLWQDGMDEWLPLRVVAGLDEPEVVNVSIPPTVPPAAMATTNASWPPVPAAPQSFRPSPPSARPPISNPPPAPGAPQSFRPSPPSARPPISNPPPRAQDSARPPISNPAPRSLDSVRPPISNPPPGSRRPPISNPPPGAFAATVASPFGLSPSYAPPAVGGSFRPEMLSPIPHVYAKPLNPMPIVLAALVGLVVTLYRNEVLHAGAKTVGQESAYLKLEAALGGPGFGTPRFVEPMTKAAAALPEIAPLPAPSSTSKYDSPSSDSSDSSSSTTQATTVAKPTPVAQAERKVTAPSPERQNASRNAPTRPAVAEASNPVFQQPKGAKKAKGNEFDPLNPNL